MSFLHLVLVLFDAVDKPPGFSPNLQVFLPWSPGFWSFGVEMSAKGPLFSEAHIKRTPYIILSERMAHFVWRLSSHFYCKASLYSGNTTKVTWVSYTCQLFLRYKCEIFILGHDHSRRFPKKSEVFRRCLKSAKGEVIEKTLIHKDRRLLLISAL